MRDGGREGERHTAQPPRDSCLSESQRERKAHKQESPLSRYLSNRLPGDGWDWHHVLLVAGPACVCVCANPIPSRSVAHRTLCCQEETNTATNPPRRRLRSGCVSLNNAHAVLLPFTYLYGGTLCSCLLCVTKLKRNRQKKRETRLRLCVCDTHTRQPDGRTHRQVAPSGRTTWHRGGHYGSIVTYWTS